jgi:hypothetical protein
MTLHSIAAARPVGGSYVLVEAGKVSEEVKRGFVARVASWLVPDQVHGLIEALSAELQAMAAARHAETSWRVLARDGSVVLETTGVSPLREHAGTVADTLMASFEALRDLPKYVRRRS